MATQPRRNRDDRTTDDHRQGNGAPPMLEEGRNSVRALAASPEDAQPDKDGSHRESDATHTERLVGPLTSPFHAHDAPARRLWRHSQNPGAIEFATSIHLGWARHRFQRQMLVDNAHEWRSAESPGSGQPPGACCCRRRLAERARQRRHVGARGRTRPSPATSRCRPCGTRRGRSGSGVPSRARDTSD